MAACRRRAHTLGEGPIRGAAARRRNLSVKILLTGKTGQVGWELARTLAPLGELRACGRDELDLSLPDRAVALVRGARPDVIVNAAAYTAVDRAEGDSEAAFAANARGPGFLAEEAAKLGALLIHYSTDYVFDGAKSGPYDEDDAPHPINVYGASKLAGEEAIRRSAAAHWIFRTSWVYAPRGKNFLLTILRLAREGKPLRVVADQFGAPTSAAMIARATAEALSRFAAGSKAAPGVYHMSAQGSTSWHGFARAILAEFGFGNEIEAISAAEYPLPARRPANSVLSNARLAEVFGIRLPSWEEGMREAAQVLLSSR
ncbi:MAG: dTDP-4-dehydrorhamnose reductase [Betaproteobacteria bacterium]|nr:dTDP-4-dehydrorhamnose reductase [Betaproteobacteria bacterium]